MIRSPGLVRGESLDLRIEKGVYRGLGLARHEGQVVFVPRALPGDRVRVLIESVRGGYVEGKAESLLEPSPDSSRRSWSESALVRSPGPAHWPLWPSTATTCIALTYPR